MEEKIKDGKDVLDNIKEWINNVDIKISILIAFMVVVLGYIFIDSESVIINKIIANIVNGSITFIKIIKGGLIIALYISTICSIVKLITALKAKIDIEKYKQQGLTINSLMFYGSISKMEYDEFMNKSKKQNDESKLNDIYSQIYINSKICNKKFENYNLGLDLAKTSIVLLFVCKILAII